MCKLRIRNVLTIQAPGNSDWEGKLSTVNLHHWQTWANRAKSGLCFQLYKVPCVCHEPGNTKGGSITVPLTSCLTGLESAVWQMTIFVFICKGSAITFTTLHCNGSITLKLAAEITSYMKCFYVCWKSENVQDDLLGGGIETHDVMM
jgi:hypothetical protein